MNPAVVVSAYNRPAALERLLESLRGAAYPPEIPVPLVISIDAAGKYPEVERIARQTAWPYGPKEILCRGERLGPVEHFYACGDLARKYGAIVFLEDDLLVSPQFYAYASQALDAYAGDGCVGGLSLYALWFNGYTQEEFIPLGDESDVFFVQVPYTQGLAFTGSQWSTFRDWKDSPAAAQPVSAPLHESWGKFKPDEWFPQLTRYLVSTGKYFVYPRVSVTTGFGDAGTHFARSTSFFQAPMQRSPRTYTFQSWQDSPAVYDSFFELLPDRMDRLTSSFHWFSYTVDLNATRSAENIRTPFVLTTRPCRYPVMLFGREMRPPEANLEYRVPGRDIYFCRLQDLRWDPLAELEVIAGRWRYSHHGRRVGLKEWLKGVLGDTVHKFRTKYRI